MLKGKIVLITIPYDQGDILQYIRIGASSLGIELILAMDGGSTDGSRDMLVNAYAKTGRTSRRRGSECRGDRSGRQLHDHERGLVAGTQDPRVPVISAARGRETMRFTLFDEVFRTIDQRIATAPSDDVPRLFRDVPLDAFGDLSLDVPTQFPNLRAFLPSMPPAKVQVNWTGDHGTALLQVSLAFVKTLVEHYEAITGRSIGDATVLDFGCGSGGSSGCSTNTCRMSRFMRSIPGTSRLRSVGNMV